MAEGSNVGSGGAMFGAGPEVGAGAVTYIVAVVASCGISREQRGIVGAQVVANGVGIDAVNRP